jgi:nitroreductase
MDVMDAIKGRRSIRKYSDRAIEEEKLSSVLEAGRLAPSATNAQTWRFVVVSDRKMLQELMEAAYGQPFVGQAPAAIVACGTKKQDHGLRAANRHSRCFNRHVVHAAGSLGTGTRHMLAGQVQRRKSEGNFKNT